MVSAAIAGRTGLPVTTVAAPSGTRSVAAKLSASISACRARNRLARPSTAFCSCRITGGRCRISRVASTGATHGYPPNPTTAAALFRARICRACTTPPASASIAAPPRNAPRPAIPAPLMTNRSSPANTELCNPPDRASVISATRRPRFSNSPASASAGKKWPPVPPAAITMGNTAGPLMARRHDAGAASAPAACPCPARPRAPKIRHRR